MPMSGAVSLLLLVVYLTVDQTHAVPRPVRAVGDTSQDLRDVVDELATKVDTLQASLSALQHSSSSGGAVHDSSHAVAFTAKSSADQLQVSATTQILQFDLATVNVGRAFDTETSVFSAPWPGTYVFLLNLKAMHKKTEQVAIDVDGKEIATALSDSEHVRVGNGHAVAHLTAGQQVCVRHIMGDRLVNGTDYTIFSGFLVQAD